MKRSIIILVCSLVSAAILLAQTDSSQTPTTQPTTQKTSASTAKTSTAKTAAGAKTSATAAKTSSAKTTSATTAKPATSATTAKSATTGTAAGKSTAATASKTGTAHPAAAKTTSAAGAKPAVSKTSAAAQWTTTGSGLKYQDVVVGKGPLPKPGDDVLVNYTGRFTNGKVFDTSLAPGRGPFELHLGRSEVIKGWDEGLSTMHVGGKRKLVIPPDLAYGPGGYPGVIPPNSTLTFDVELLKIK